jgi:GntR family transcriptional regulator
MNFIDAPGGSAELGDRRDVRRQLRTSSLPFYVALANLLRSDILEGRLQAGAQLPTLDQLSERYGVARVTVRQALGVLSDDGLIERVQGKGTFVKDGFVRRKTIELESNWSNFLQMLDGNVPEPLSVQSNVPLPRMGNLEGSALDRYRFMRRVHRAGTEAYCVIDLYLAEECYEIAPDAFDSEMVITVLGRVCGARLKRMTQSFRIMSADLFVAKQLGLSVNAPVGEVRRVITDHDGRILYLGVGQYRGDLVVFNTTLEVPSDRPVEG